MIHGSLCPPVLSSRYPLQKASSIVFRQQDGSGQRHVFCQSLTDVEFGEHQRQTLAHLVKISVKTQQHTAVVHLSSIVYSILWLNIHPDER